MKYTPGLFVSALLAASLMAPPAVADTPIDKEAAVDNSFDRLVDQARQAFDDGDYEAAIEYLTVAKRHRAEKALLLNIARSYERLGDCSREIAYYRAYLAEDPDEDALVERAENAVEEAAEKCDDYSDELSGPIAFDSSPPVATVYLEERRVGTTPTATAAVEPGEYEVRFELDDHREYTTDLELTGDPAVLEVEAELQELDEAHDPDDEQAGDESDDPDDEQAGDEPDDQLVADIEQPTETPDQFSPPPLALGLLAGGVAATAGGGVLDLWLIPHIDEQRQQARDIEDFERVDELTSQRRTAVVGAIAAYVAGGVLTAGSLGWIGYDHFQGDPANGAEARWGLSPRIGPRAGGMTVFGRF